MGNSTRVFGWDPVNGFGVKTTQGWEVIDWAGTGDFDGDGKSDLALFGGRTAKRVRLGPGQRLRREDHPGWEVIDWAGTGDFDGDGKSDLALSVGNSMRVFGWDPVNGFGVKTTQGWEVIDWASNGTKRRATQIQNQSPPVVRGTPRVGLKLTASPGSWTPSATYQYQWWADGGWAYAWEPQPPRRRAGPNRTWQADQREGDEWAGGVHVNLSHLD